MPVSVCVFVCVCVCVCEREREREREKERERESVYHMVHGLKISLGSDQHVQCTCMSVICGEVQRGRV